MLVSRALRRPQAHLRSGLIGRAMEQVGQGAVSAASGNEAEFLDLTQEVRRIIDAVPRGGHLHPFQPDPGP